MSVNFQTAIADVIEPFHFSSLNYDVGGIYSATDTSTYTSPSWHSLSGPYEITSGDTFPMPQVKGNDGTYVRVIGEECSSILGACDPSRPVSSTVDLAAIAGAADLYWVQIEIDVVVEGDIDDDFTWQMDFTNINNTYSQIIGRWSENSLSSTCLQWLDPSHSECTFWSSPSLDYDSGTETRAMHFWVLDQTSFSTDFLSTEGWGAWAIDGFWGFDNLTVTTKTYFEKSEDNETNDGDGQGSEGAATDVPEPSVIFLLLAGFLILIGCHRRGKIPPLARAKMYP